jgi:hypothetical protein
MPIPVTVSIPHNLGQAEARRRIEQGFGTIEQSMTGPLMGMLSFQKRWENDQLHFEGGALGQKLTGSLHVLEHAVQIQIYLPEFLAALADRMKGTLQKQTQRLLEKQ